MDKASEAILALKPVTFHYEGDAKDTPQFRLIAEEVAEVNPPPRSARQERGNLERGLRPDQRDAAQRVP
jgi:hypothetical protein